MPASVILNRNDPSDSVTGMQPLNAIIEFILAIKTFAKLYSGITHCAKSFQIPSFFWSVFFCTWSEYGDLQNNILPRLTLSLFHFFFVDLTMKFFVDIIHTVCF